MYVPGETEVDVDDGVTVLVGRRPPRGALLARWALHRTRLPIDQEVGQGEAVPRGGLPALVTGYGPMSVTPCAAWLVSRSSVST